MLMLQMPTEVNGACHQDNFLMTAFVKDFSMMNFGRKKIQIEYFEDNCLKFQNLREGASIFIKLFLVSWIGVHAYETVNLFLGVFQFFNLGSLISRYFSLS